MSESNIFGNIWVRYPLDRVLKDFVSATAKAGFSDRIVLKGGLNLEVALKKYSDTVRARPTVDADFHMRRREDWEDFLLKVPTDVASHSALEMKYSIIYRRGFEKHEFSDSITIETDQGHKFDVDMNLSDFPGPTELYLDDYLPGFTVPTMLVDKISVFCSEKIYRRSKDMYDLFLISYMKDFIMKRLLAEMSNKLEFSKGVPDTIHIANLDKLEHAYSRLMGIPDKPDFDLVYKRVTNFIYPIVECLLSGDLEKGDVWLSEKGKWID